MLLVFTRKPSCRKERRGTAYIVRSTTGLQGHPRSIILRHLKANRPM